MDNRTPDLVSVIDDLLLKISVILELGGETPRQITEELVNLVYRLTYEITLAKANNVVLIKEDDLIKMNILLNSNMYVPREETNHSELEYKIYQILRLLKALDKDMYKVVMKALGR